MGSVPEAGIEDGASRRETSVASKTNPFACYLPERTPPIGVPLAIYACSTEDFTEWFTGRYDGRHWRATDVDERDGNAWYVLGWRQTAGPMDDACMDCRALPTHPSGIEPALLNAGAGLDS